MFTAVQPGLPGDKRVTERDRVIGRDGEVGRPCSEWLVGKAGPFSAETLDAIKTAESPISHSTCSVRLSAVSKTGIKVSQQTIGSCTHPCFRFRRRTVGAPAGASSVVTTLRRLPLVLQRLTCHLRPIFLSPPLSSFPTGPQLHQPSHHPPMATSSAATAAFITEVAVIVVGLFITAPAPVAAGGDGGWKTGR